MTKTRKIGGSLMVTIPKVVAEEEGLMENQTVKIEMGKVKKSGFGLFKGTGSFKKEDRMKGQLE